MTIVELIVLGGVLVFASHFFSWLFSYTKVPDALLLMIVGLLLGPILGLTSPEFFGEAGELAVMVVLVVLLFQSGLGLRFAVLRQAWRTTVLVSVVSFVVMMLVVAAVLWMVFGLDPLVAFTVGTILGGTSSVVVIPLMRQLSVEESTRTTLTLESVFSDVLTVVVTIALLEAYAVGSVQVTQVVGNIVLSFIGAAVVGGVVALVWARLLRVVRQMKNSMFTTPALVFVLFGLTERMGLSGPIAALAFGIVMGNLPGLNAYLERRHPFLRLVLMASSLRKREKLFFAELVFLLKTFFFVFVGLSLRLDTVSSFVIALALVVFMVLVRLLVVRMVVPKMVTEHDATLMAIMVPKGLAAVALASLPLQYGVPDGEMILEITYAVVLVSVLVTSVLVFAVQRTKLGEQYAVWLSPFRDS